MQNKWLAIESADRVDRNASEPRTTISTITKPTETRPSTALGWPSFPEIQPSMPLFLSISTVTKTWKQVPLPVRSISCKATQCSTGRSCHRQNRPLSGQKLTKELNSYLQVTVNNFTMASGSHSSFFAFTFVIHVVILVAEFRGIR